MMKFLLVVIIGASMLLGCGGHRHHSAITPVNTDGLIGSWSGTYHLINAGTGSTFHSGTIKITVTRSGATGHDAGVDVVGTVEDDERKAGTVAGYVTDYVQAVGSGLSFSFASLDNDSYVGRLEVDARGHLTGTLNLALGDGGLPTAFDLAPLAAEGQARR